MLFGLFPQQFNDLLLLLINPLSLPRHDTEYYSAAPGLVWYSQYWQSGFNLSGGQSQAPEEYVGGQQLTDNWDAYPLHPAPNVRLRAPAGISTLPSASRQGNTLTLDITPFSDNQPGHLGAGFFSGFGSGSPSRHCVVQPMMTLRYQVAGLSLAGKAKSGSQSLDLFAGHLQAATQAATQAAITSA